MATMPLTGGCLCEGVRFEVSEPLHGALYCHCTRCQRRTGTAFSVSALTVAGLVRDHARGGTGPLVAAGRRLGKGLLRRVRKPSLQHQPR